MYISTHALTEGDGAGSFWRVCGRISTHALTEGDLQKYNFHLSAHISTHALTEGGFPLQEKSFSNPLFQLTPSRRATINAKIEFELEMISTHALTEGDSAAARSFRSLRHFNSRPHGGRLLCTLGRRTRYIFQLTPSRRATVVAVEPFLTIGFQLTPSRRATGNRAELRIRRKFQLTPSRRATSCIIEKIKHYKDFNSRPHGGRHENSEWTTSMFTFQLTPSRRATLLRYSSPRLRVSFQLTPSRRAT